MLTEQDIENILDGDTPDKIEWEHWPDPPAPGTKCWSSSDENWLIQYIPDPGAPCLAIGRSDEGHVYTWVEGIGDNAACKLLRAAAKNPEATMKMLHEEVDAAETQFCGFPGEIPV
jgi:hypothetical protein